MIYKIAFVKWIDSTYYQINETVKKEDINYTEPKTIYSVGLLIHDDLKCLIISQDVEISSDSCRLILSIPKVSILDYEVKKIKVKCFDKK